MRAFLASFLRMTKSVQTVSAAPMARQMIQFWMKPASAKHTKLRQATVMA